MKWEAKHFSMQRFVVIQRKVHKEKGGISEDGVKMETKRMSHY